MRFLLVAAWMLGGLTAAAHGVSPATAVVERLYRSFAWEAVLEGQGHAQAFIDQPRAVLRRYLSQGLTEALLRERQCAQRRREICALDFAPLWDSQDPRASDLRVSFGFSTAQVLVSFRAGPSQDRRELRMTMVREASGWRIDDVRYPDGRRLRDLLERAQP